MTPEEWRRKAMATRPKLTPAQLMTLRGVVQPAVSACHAETAATTSPERTDHPCQKVPA